MKTSNEKTVTVINGTERGIYNELKFFLANERKNNLIGDTLMTLISENAVSNENKIIAKKCIDNDTHPNKDEAIKLTYEISKNRNHYLSLMETYADVCRNDAFDVLKEMYPSKSDSEIKTMIR